MLAPAHYLPSTICLGNGVLGMRRGLHVARGVVAPLALLPLFGALGGTANGASLATITRLAGVIGSGPAASTAMQVDYDAVSGRHRHRGTRR
jgi:hypothetical protein